MTPCECVMAALKHEPVDRVPWIEGIVGNGIASAVCGEPVNVDWSVAPDGFPKQSGEELANEQKKVNRVRRRRVSPPLCFYHYFMLCFLRHQLERTAPVSCLSRPMEGGIHSWILSLSSWISGLAKHDKKSKAED